MTDSALVKSFKSVWVWPVLVGSVGVSVLLFGYLPAEVPTGASPVLQVVLSILIAGLGAVIAARHAGHPIASLLYATSVGMPLLMAATLVVEVGNVPVIPTFWDYAASWIFNFVGSVILYPVLLILFIFPTRYFLTRRWKWVGWATAAFTVVLGFVVLFSEEVGKIYDPESQYWHLVNPIGFLPPEIAESLLSSSVGVMMWLAVGGVTAMIVRYRRSDSLVRTQIKWVVYASAVAAAALASISLGGGNETLYLAQTLTALAVIPLAITIAITRYKLFEIDRLISRTISYAMVIALLGVVFAVGVVWIPTALDLGNSSLLVAASTLAVASLFNPLRKRVQRVVDRRFNRSAYQAEQVSEEFAAKLRRQLSTQQITTLWTQTAEQALQPQAVGIWLKES